MTLYAVVALGDLGITVHIYFSDTCLLVLALRRVPELSAESVMMVSTGASDDLSNSSLSTMLWVLTREALPRFHALTGANITGHRTQGKRKPTYFKMFLKHILDLTFYGYFNSYMAFLFSSKSWLH